MFKDINASDNLLIQSLESTFCEKFKQYKIKNDFEQNIFSKYFIYMEKSNIIGFINYYDMYERFELSYIEVKEEYRNQKIGSKLIEHLIEIAKSKNIDNITLEVNINNIYAIKLYEKYGFKKVAIRKGYYDGIDGYLMERKMM